LPGRGAAEQRNTLKLPVYYREEDIPLVDSYGDFMGGIFELPSGKVESGEGLDVANLWEYLGNFDYLSGTGKKSRQFNFVVDVVVTEPVELREYDSYTWTALNEEPPVTDAVKEVLRRYCGLKDI
jgi:8-oxo-dGTP diphosphatase